MDKEKRWFLALFGSDEQPNDIIKYCSGRKDCQGCLEIWMIASDKDPKAWNLTTKSKFDQLIKDGHNVNTTSAKYDDTDEDGEASAIFIALKRKGADVAKHLIAQNGIILSSQTSISGRTALHEAVMLQDPDLVKQLLKRCETVDYIDRQDKYGRTAFHEAVYLGHPEIISLLISYEADVNIADAQGLSALHLLVLHRYDMERIKDIGWACFENLSTNMSEISEETKDQAETATLAVIQRLILSSGEVNTNDIFGAS